MTLSIATACIGRVEITEQFLQTTIANCSGPHRLVVASNGSTDDENERLEGLLNALEGWDTRLLVAPHPMGISGAFNAAVEACEDGVVVALQNDLLVLQKGWDVRVEEFFAATPEAGVVGFAGGKGIGRHDIYRSPYELTQLARNTVFSSLDDWQVHGAQCVRPEPVVVLDGLALCFRKSEFRQWGGYDEKYHHHMYDIDISLTAHYAGKINYVIPVLCKHLGGQTVNHSQAYADSAAPMGGDAGVHAISHEYMYEKWRGKMPVRVS